MNGYLHRELLAALAAVALGAIICAGAARAASTSSWIDQTLAYFGPAVGATGAFAYPPIAANADWLALNYGADSVLIYARDKANGEWISSPQEIDFDPTAEAGCAPAQPRAVAVSGNVVAVALMTDFSYGCQSFFPATEIVIYKCSVNASPNCVAVQTLADPTTPYTNVFSGTMALANSGETLLVYGYDPTGTAQGIQDYEATDGGPFHYKTSLSPGPFDVDTQYIGYLVADGAGAMAVAGCLNVMSCSGVDWAYVFSDTSGSWQQTAAIAQPPEHYFAAEAALSGSGAHIIGDSGLWNYQLEDEDWINIQTIHSTTQTAVASGLGGLMLFVGDYSGNAYLYARADSMEPFALTATFPYSSPNTSIFAAFSGGSTPVLLAMGIPATRPSSHGTEYGFATHSYTPAAISLVLDAPGTAVSGSQYVLQAIATNEATHASPAFAVSVSVPLAASITGADAIGGACTTEAQGVKCAMNPLTGSGGAGTVNVTLTAPATTGITVTESASIVGAVPAVAATATTLISVGVPPPAAASPPATVSPPATATPPATAIPPATAPEAPPVVLPPPTTANPPATVPAPPDAPPPVSPPRNPPANPPTGNPPVMPPSNPPATPPKNPPSRPLHRPPTIQPDPPIAKPPHNPTLTGPPHGSPSGKPHHPKSGGGAFGLGGLGTLGLWGVGVPLIRRRRRQRI